MKLNGMTSLIYLCSIVGLSVTSAQVLSQNIPVAEVPSTIMKERNSAEHSSAKKELHAILSRLSSMQANFSQQIFDLQGEELQSSTGSIILNKPQMLRWNVKQPEESMLIADGETVYNIDPFVEQVTLMDQSSLTKTNPLMLLISDDTAQWDNVEIEKIEGDFVVRSMDKDAAVQLVILTFNTNKELTLLTSLDKQQQRNVIAFSNIELNHSIPSHSFTYAADASWSVDDQRALN